jgi:hypothetical protein
MRKLALAFAVSAAVAPHLAQGTAITYRLVRYDGGPVPAVGDSLGMPGGCVTHYVSSWYRISGERFEYADTMTFTHQCSGGHPTTPVEVNHVRGTISRKGDTLVFHAVSLYGNPYVQNRGLFRRDSLRTDGDLFDGPARLYVR